MRTSKYFDKQFSTLTIKSQNIIENKFKLIKQNPYRFTRLQTKFPLFRVRVNIEGKDTRLIYTLYEGIIILLLIERKKGYKGIEKEIERILKK